MEMNTTQLSAADVLPRHDYERVRAAWRDALVAHRSERRLVFDVATVLFESRATVLGHIQEVVYVEQCRSPRAIREQVAEYARLLPSPTVLSATVFVHADDAAQGRRLAWALGTGAALSLETEPGRPVEGQALDPPDDGPVHYLAFRHDGALSRRHPARLFLRWDEQVRTAPLPEAVRRSPEGDLLRLPS